MSVLATSLCRGHLVFSVAELFTCVWTRARAPFLGSLICEGYFSGAAVEKAEMACTECKQASMQVFWFSALLPSVSNWLDVVHYL